MNEISDYDKLIIMDSWPYRFTYGEYDAARRRAGLGVGIRTNGVALHVASVPA